MANINAVTVIPKIEWDNCIACDGDLRVTKMYELLYRKGPRLHVDPLVKYVFHAQMLKSLDDNVTTMVQKFPYPWIFNTAGKGDGVGTDSRSIALWQIRVCHLVHWLDTQPRNSVRDIAIHLHNTADQRVDSNFVKWGVVYYTYVRAWHDRYQRAPLTETTAYKTEISALCQIGIAVQNVDGRFHAAWSAKMAKFITTELAILFAYAKKYKSKSTFPAKERHEILELLKWGGHTNDPLHAETTLLKLADTGRANGYGANDALEMIKSRSYAQHDVAFELPATTCTEQELDEFFGTCERYTLPTVGDYHWEDGNIIIPAATATQINTEFMQRVKQSTTDPSTGATEPVKRAPVFSWRSSAPAKSTVEPQQSTSKSMFSWSFTSNADDDDDDDYEF